MFMLAALPIGLLIGRLTGGSLEALSRFRFRWAALAITGLLVQVVLFSEAGDALAGDLGPAIYVVSTAAVLVAVIPNLALGGMPAVALGALSNLAAIIANGGFMPASAEALAAAGLDGPGSHTNSIVLEQPNLEPLTDIHAIPAGIPLANVFSVGDVVIGIGVAWAIAAAMRRPATA
jgi:hypothetical protein